MDPIRGVRCPNCGIKHNAPTLHRCKYVNPGGVKKAERNRGLKAALRQQKHLCVRCLYELPDKGNTLDQITSVGVVCKSCLREDVA